MNRHITYSFFLLILLLISQVIWAQPRFEVLRNNVRDGIYYQYYGISCSDDNNCTVVGYALDPMSNPAYEINIERTTDGGATWIKQESGYQRRSSIDDAFLRTVDAIDSLNIVIVGDGGLVDRTTDGGASWHPQTSNNQWKIEGISFIDSANGMIVGGPVQFTTNAGATWETIEGLKSTTFSDSKMFSKDEQILLEYGYGPFYHTTDRWHSWDATESFRDTTQTDPVKIIPKAFFEDSRHFFAYGSHITSKNIGTTRNSYILRTDDAGQHWQTILDTADPRLISGLQTMAINKNGLGIAGGYGLGGILYTTDHGFTWKSDTLDAPIEPTNAMAASFPGDNEVYIVAQSGFTAGRILKLHFPKLLKVNVYERLIHGTHIFPNPANDWTTVYIDPAYEASYTIYDILGRKVKDFEATEKSTKIYTKDMVSGVYRLISNYDKKRISIGNLIVTHQ